MNGWNGFNLPMGVSPSSFGGFGGSMPPPTPYMTPTGGSESLWSNPVRSGIAPINTTVPTGGVGAPGGWFGIQGLGANLDTARLGIGALTSIANIWNASQQNKLAKASFNHQKGILDTNLANQIKSYNLSIDDKFRSRAVVEGRSDSQRDADIQRWSARDERRG